MNNAIERWEGGVRYERRKAMKKSPKPLPIKAKVRRWFIMDRDGVLVEQKDLDPKHSSIAEVRARKWDLQFPSYAPHKAVYLKEVDPPSNKKGIVE